MAAPFRESKPRTTASRRARAGANERRALQANALEDDHDTDDDYSTTDKSTSQRGLQGSDELSSTGDTDIDDGKGDVKSSESAADGEFEVESATEEISLPKTKPKLKGKLKPKLKPKPKSEGLTMRGDSYTYKNGIDEDIPPITSLYEIFEDLVDRWTRLEGSKVTELLEFVKGRRIRVATMCSGTESPVLALNIIGEIFLSQAKSFGVDHLFSAEIVAWKQAYINLNFGSTTIFRDITDFFGLRGLTVEEIKNFEIETAFAGKALIADKIDILIAGTCCVDFSNLNGNKKGLEQGGESGDTFFAMRMYAIAKRPAVIILENVSGAPFEGKEKIDKTGEATFEMGINTHMSEIHYASRFLKLDTKDFYLPHTRKRGYMICVDMEPYMDGESYDMDQVTHLYREPRKLSDLLDQWVDMVRNLQRRASVPVECMLLDSDDPVFDSSSVTWGDDGAKDKKSAPWEACKIGYRNYRHELALGQERNLVKWVNEACFVLPDWYHRLVTGFTERILDTFNVAHLRNLRRGIDDRYYMRTLELSQNVYFNTDSTAQGLIGAITPTGRPFPTTRGGRLSGLESLVLQGLPTSRLDLSRFTQPQLTDLAGNAMTSTVIGACLLAAISLFHPDFTLSDPLDKEAVKHELARESSLTETHSSTASCEIDLFCDDVIKQANSGRRLCYCESRHTVKISGFQECTVCKHVTCVTCGKEPKHNYKPLDIKPRSDPVEFEAMLRKSMPTKIRISAFDKKASASMLDKQLRKTLHENYLNIDTNRWQANLEHVKKALQSEVYLRHIRRREQWEIEYSSSSAILLGTISNNSVEWKIYANVEKEPLGSELGKYLRAFPIARMTVSRGEEHILKGCWKLWLPRAREFDALLSMTGPMLPSYENYCGLLNATDTYVCSNIDVQVKDFDDRCFERDIRGQYKLSQECGQAFNSLHVKMDGAETERPLFLFLEHHLRGGNPTDHSFIFTEDQRRLEKLQHRHSVAHIEPSFRQPKASRLADDALFGRQGQSAAIARYQFDTEDSSPENEVKKQQNIKIHTDGTWTDFNGISFNAHGDTELVTYHTLPAQVSLQLPCGEPLAVFECQTKLEDRPFRNWLENQWTEVDVSKEADFTHDFRWILEKGLVMKGHEEETSNWQCISYSDVPDTCPKCSPNLPRLLWCFNEHGKQVPHEDPREASEREQALKARPSPVIVLYLLNDGDINIQIGVDAETLIHRATSRLVLKPAPDATDFSTSWRLVTDSESNVKPAFEPIKLIDNQHREPAEPPILADGMQLRLEQLRALGWMQDQEGSPKSFVEEEVVEANAIHLGYRAEGRATRKITRRGGILAFDVAFGKTAISLALIQKREEEDKKHSKKTIKGAIPLKATLIVVPNHLPDQWHEEIKKFLGDKYWKNTLVIKHIADLKKTIISELQKKDIIIITMSVLQGSQYKAFLARFAGVVEVDDRATKRAKSTWRRNAFTKVRQNVDLLRDRPSDFGRKLTEQFLQDVKDAQGNEVPVPSKRVNGKAYISKQDPGAGLKKKRKGPAMAKPNGPKKNGGRPAEDSTDSESTFEDDEALKNNFQSTSEDDELKKRQDQFRQKLQSWEVLKSPVLEMFSFSRLIVDEFTYFKDSETIFEGIRSKCNWILSGTPPLGSFEEIKTMATFLKINLGIDDYSPTPTDDMTNAEKFWSYTQVHSPAWHRRRYGLCKLFMTTFARREASNLSGIKSVELYPIVHQPNREWAFYQELQQLLAASGFENLLRNKYTDSDAENNIRHALASCEDVREALLLRSTGVSLLANSGGNETQSEATVKIRKDEESGIESSIKMALRQAELLDLTKEENDETYLKWKALTRGGSYGDAEVTQKLKHFMEEAYAARSDTKDEWKMFYRLANQKDADKGKPMKPEGRVKSGQLSHLYQKVAQLRQVTIDIDRLVESYIKHTRSLRFFQAVLDGQKSKSFTCGDCKKSELSAADVILLTKCGHLVCKDQCASVRERYEGGCPVCNALNHSYQRVSGSALSRPEPVVIHECGQKLGQLVTLIQQIPKDDRVIIFVQFEKAHIAVKEILQTNKITVMDLMGARDTSEKLMAFQKNEMHGTRAAKLAAEKAGRSLKGAKVLLLNISDASAAGSNLTCANHIIFVSPYYVKGSSAQQLWESTMTQAMGRAKRWGQRKMVYAYHFATSETIDVDIIEQRNPGKMLRIQDYGGEEDDEDENFVPLHQRAVLEDLGFDQMEAGGKTPLSSAIADIVFMPSDFE